MRARTRFSLMGDSRRSPPADAPARGRAVAASAAEDARSAAPVRAAVAAALAETVPNGGRIAVALSGGRDSVALLDAAVAVAAAARCDIIALHVNHGISANAGAWARACDDLCLRLGVTLASRSVSVARGPRVSLEAAARTSRYAALEALARDQRAEAVLLAHHADDQAETTLLQLLRGAGPRGLAAMPRARLADGLWWLRPLLDLPRATLDAYVHAHALRYVDDESNADPRHRRNALRRDVVPALRAIAPGYPAQVVRAARHQAEAALLQDDLAEHDALAACDGETLDCATLRSLAPHRARNLLRWFVASQRLPAPSTARLSDMLRQLATASADARVAISHAGTEFGVHRGRIVVHRAAPDAYDCPWNGATTVELPHGTLAFAATRGGGIATHHLESSRVTVRNGRPGERLQLGPRGSRRGVSELLREAGVPAWNRLAVPRVYCGARLAAVPGIGVDVAFAAEPDEPSFALHWQPARG